MGGLEEFFFVFLYGLLFVFNSSSAPTLITKILLSNSGNGQKMRDFELILWPLPFQLLFGSDSHHGNTL
jgi:hypothetical protein